MFLIREGKQEERRMTYRRPAVRPQSWLRPWDSDISNEGHHQPDLGSLAPEAHTAPAST